MSDEFGNARVRFWMCPLKGHSDRREDGRIVVTVEWDDQGVAHCTAPGCTLTSEQTTGTIRAAYEYGVQDARPDGPLSFTTMLAVRLLEVDSYGGKGTWIRYDDVVRVARQIETEGEDASTR